jgi:hypothetical protein
MTPSDEEERRKRAPGLDHPPTEICSIMLHGHRPTYRLGGDGPLLVPLPGIANSSVTWSEVMVLLARGLHRPCFEPSRPR